MRLYNIIKQLTINNNVLFQIRKMSGTNKLIIEQKVSVDNINLNYVKSGTGKKSVLLMPGALGSSWSDFKPQIEQLPTLIPEYTIIAWDPPGYGHSIPPIRDFNLDFFKQDATLAHKLMVTLGINKYSVLGWSDGGITGMITAATFPKFIDKLVIWGANAYIIPEEIKIYESIRDINKWSEKMRKPLVELYGTEYFAKTWNDWVDIFIKINKEKSGNLCKSFLDKIEAPTYILHGTKDPMIAAEHVPYLLKNIKGSRLHEFPNGKHNIHLRYADEFNKLIADFLNE